MKVMSCSTAVTTMRQFCRDRGCPETARQISAYFKGVVKLHGMRTAGVKSIFTEVCPKKVIKTWDIEDIMTGFRELISSKYQEEKRLSIYFLNSRVKDLTLQHVKELETVIDEHVYDWATCDMLSSTVIRYVVNEDENVAKLMLKWSTAECIWRQRSSCVSFVVLAKHGNHNDVILKICSNCVTSEERFVQLGVGWVLRELGQDDLKTVVKFIVDNYNHFSREGLRYAIERMKDPLRKHLLSGNLKEATTAAKTAKTKRRRCDRQLSDSDSDSS